MSSRTLRCASLLLLPAIAAWGQHSAPPPPHGAPMERMFHTGPPGKWWTDPARAQRLGLTAEQQKKIEALFQQSRLRLIDLSAALEKEEVILEPLLEADRPDAPKILQQIDRIAQARAELEKANARFLLGIRNILTLDQWRKLEDERPPPRENRPARYL